MEEQEHIHSDYLKGFNDGYLISQYLPQLAEQLSLVDSNQHRIVGLQDGHKQYLAEQQIKNRLPDWLKGNQSKSDKANSAKGKDRSIEPDK